jgi:hypothetical protein
MLRSSGRRELKTCHPRDLLVYLLSLSVGISVGLFVHRIYVRGSHRLRVGLTAIVVVVLAVALLMAIIGR